MTGSLRRRSGTGSKLRGGCVWPGGLSKVSASAPRPRLVAGSVDITPHPLRSASLCAPDCSASSPPRCLPSPPGPPLPSAPTRIGERCSVPPPTPGRLQPIPGPSRGRRLHNSGGRALDLRGWGRGARSACSRGSRPGSSPVRLLSDGCEAFIGQFGRSAAEGLPGLTARGYPSSTARQRGARGSGAGGGRFGVRRPDPTPIALCRAPLALARRCSVIRSGLSPLNWSRVPFKPGFPPPPARFRRRELAIVNWEKRMDGPRQAGSPSGRLTCSSGSGIQDYPAGKRGTAAHVHGYASEYSFPPIQI